MVNKSLYCGTITKKILYPIFTILANFCLYVVDYFIDSLEKKRKTNNEAIYGTHEFVDCHFMFMAESVALIFYFITLSRSKGSKIFHEEQKKLIDWIKLICLMLIVPFLDLSSFISNGITTSSSNLYNNLSLSFYIVMTAILSIMYLDAKFYRHHLIGIGVFVLGLVVNCVVDHKYTGSMYLPYYLIAITYNQLCYSLQDVFEKYLMEYKFINIYLQLGTEGIIGTFILSVSFFFIGNITCTIESELCDLGKPVDSFVDAYSFIFSHYDYLLLFLCRFVCSYLFNVMRLLTTYYYTPVHFIIYYSINNYVVWLFDYIVDKGTKKTSFVGTLIAYVLEIIGVLIFLEIIIIGLCGADKNIEQEIRNRETEDYDKRIEETILYSLNP